MDKLSNFCVEQHIIPPWCEGIYPQYWRTNAGLNGAMDLWKINEKEAITLTAALEIVFSRTRPFTQRMFRYAHKRLQFYPSPFVDSFNPRSWGKFYVLRSDVERLRVKRLSNLLIRAADERYWDLYRYDRLRQNS